MRNNVYPTTIRSLGYVLAQLQGAFFDGGAGRDGGCDDFYAVGLHGSDDAAPVLHAGDEGAGDFEGVEAHETVGEDYGVFGRSCGTVSCILSSNPDRLPGYRATRLTKEKIEAHTVSLPNRRKIILNRAL